MSKGKPLSIDQVAQLEQLVIGENMTDKDVAAKIGCSIPTVVRYRKKRGLHKKGPGKLKVDPDSMSRVSINQQEGTLEEKEARWAANLRASKRFPRVQQQFIAADVEFFIEQWVTYHMQLEAMTPAEEDILENLIIYNLRIIANQRNMKQLEEQEIMLKRQLYGENGERELDLEDENQKWLWSVCESNDRRKQEVNKELKDLRDGLEKLHRMLNTTREQREQKNKIGADTFLTLVRMFQDKAKRKEIGKESEYIRISTEKQSEKLKKIHVFSDSSQEAVLLDGADFKKTPKEGIKIHDNPTN